MALLLITSKSSNCHRNILLVDSKSTLSNADFFWFSAPAPSPNLTRELFHLTSSEALYDASAVAIAAPVVRASKLLFRIPCLVASICSVLEYGERADVIAASVVSRHRSC